MYGTESTVKLLNYPTGTYIFDDPLPIHCFPEKPDVDSEQCTWIASYHTQRVSLPHAQWWWCYSQPQTRALRNKQKVRSQCMCVSCRLWTEFHQLLGQAKHNGMCAFTDVLNGVAAIERCSHCMPTSYFRLLPLLIYFLPPVARLHDVQLYFPTHRAPRFAGYKQQDSQELLRYLLDSLRNEEIDVRMGCLSKSLTKRI